MPAALVPETLDMADRAGLCMNVLTSAVDPEYDNELYWIADLLAGPPSMYHTIDDHLQAKFMVALPICRTASGSEQNMDVEHALMHVLLKMQGEDGQIYFPIEGSHGRCRPNRIFGRDWTLCRRVITAAVW